MFELIWQLGILLCFGKIKFTKDYEIIKILPNIKIVGWVIITTEIQVKFPTRHSNLISDHN